MNALRGPLRAALLGVVGHRSWQLALSGLAALAALATAPVAAQPASTVPTPALGAGSVALAPRSADPLPPPALGLGAAMKNRAVPTNQWYGSLVFDAQPEALFAQPLTVKPVAGGLEVAYPRKTVVPTERRDVEIHYNHRPALLLAPAAFTPGPAKLVGASDWAIDISQAGTAPGDDFRATAAHGSPYVHLHTTRGDVRVTLPGGGTAEASTSADPRVLLLNAQGQRYAVFGPTGVRFEAAAAGPGAANNWLARLPAGQGQTGHIAVTALPDDSAATLALLTRHAYTVLTDTRVAWRFEVASSRVQTTYSTQHRTLEGPDVGPLLGLYPHHWFNNAELAPKLGPAYDTVRGALKLLAASGFSTSKPYQGFVPYWPAVAEGPRSEELRGLMKTDLRNARRLMQEGGLGPYWQGKGLQRISKLLDVVEQQGDADGAAQLLKLLKGRLEQWFGGQDRKTYFLLDKTTGTVLGYPEEYFSVTQLNDHHFHYGYWIRAAADVALRDPAWAAQGQWGAMVDLLVADIATAERGRADFPFLRNFDPYEGHSWASGVGMGTWGNNQESSSEALNAWAALVQWGEVTQNPALRDLGAYLFATEADALQHYWFDVHGIVFAPEYRAHSAEVSMLFGGKYAHNTWWTDEPRQIKGINLLPITTASVYLGQDPAFVQRSLATLKPETATFAARGKRADPPDIWQDIFAKYLALADPTAGLAAWDRWGAVEYGDTRSHTLHWLLSLQQLGRPDTGVTANTPLYAVFRRADGRRTYLAYNASGQTLSVRFSDGQTLQVAPRSLGRSG